MNKAIVLVCMIVVVFAVGCIGTDNIDEIDETSTELISQTSELERIKQSVITYRINEEKKRNMGWEDFSDDEDKVKNMLTYFGYTVNSVGVPTDSENLGTTVSLGMDTYATTDSDLMKQTFYGFASLYQTWNYLDVYIVGLETSSTLCAFGIDRKTLSGFIDGEQSAEEYLLAVGSGCESI